MRAPGAGRLLLADDAAALPMEVMLCDVLTMMSTETTSTKQVIIQLINKALRWSLHFIAGPADDRPAVLLG